MNTEGYARIISEKIGIPTETLAKIALANAQKVDPNAKIAFKEKRLVNGKEVIVMHIEGTLNDIPFRYYGYYYGGTSGSIQAITFTVSSAFERNAEDFTTFLNGLEITDQELPPPSRTSSAAEATDPGLLLINSGTAAVKYDPSKWKKTVSKEPGRFTFSHVGRGGYAMVIAERIGLPTDSLPGNRFRQCARG